MAYSSILIQGNIISSELLDKIRGEEIKYQTPADFGLEKKIQLRDEIGVAWAAARGHWTAFKVRRDRLQDTDSGTSETRNSWMLPLLRELGYELETSRAETLPNGKSYNISHRDARRVNLPIHITGVNDSLDRKREGVSRLSPHALVQEYLNQTEHVYGLVSNGRQLRLLRDATRLVRLSYLEFNLEKIMEEELYNEFAVLYRLLHASRMPAKPDEADASFIEFYHQESLASGNRIREKLSVAVEESILTLANGFLQHPANAELRQAVLEGRLKPDDYYQQTLRLIYRLLFLMVTEERNLVYPETLTDAQQRLRRIYTDFYSLDRLRKLAGKRLFVDGRKYDLWESLKATFLLFEDSRYGQKLGISPLGSGLFSPKALGEYLPQSRLSNESLLHALYKLSYFTSDSGSLVRVNYSDLDVEEFGSVYEGLLDLKPVVTTIGDTLHFSYEAGTDRKTTGSYYTRPELVRELVRSALDPVIAERLKPFRLPQEREAAEAALLAIRVCDPSAGSGHMLITAARELGLALAQVRTGEDQPSPTAYRDAIRTVIQQCIYGVDYNPAAVELCQVALWMESYNPGKPLSFLDHKIKHGNSLVGVFDLSDLTQGIPDDAFNPVTGDDPTVAKLLKKQNKDFRQKGQTTLDFHKAEAKLQAQQQDFAALFQNLSQAQQDSLSDIEEVRKRYENARTGSWWTDWQACNLYTAAFFQTYTDENAPDNPTSERLARYLQNPEEADKELVDHLENLQNQHYFFHWPLEFPEVFANQGFDVVIGNPPWERIKLQEQEFFGTRDQAIATAANKAARERLIRALPQTNPSLYAEFTNALHTAEAQSKFIRVAGRNPLTATGDINTYSIFAELDRNLLNPRGRAGVIVPTGIATDDNNKAFFGDLVSHNTLLSLFDFENREALFQGVHRSYKFCLLTIAGGPLAEGFEARFAFFLTNVGQLQDPQRVFALTADDFARLNPNTRTCPVFRTRQDAELTTRIYRRVPVLINEETGENPWGVSFMRMFDMSNDSHLFRTSAELEAQGYRLQGNRYQKDGEEFLPLYESKFIWHYDHRFGSYEGVDGRGSTQMPTPMLAQYQDPNYLVKPWYWVQDEEVYLAVADAPQDFKRAYRQRDWDKLKDALDSWYQRFERAQQKADEADDFVEVQSLMEEHRLSEEEASMLKRIRCSQSWPEVAKFLKHRSPEWLIGFRDVTNSTNERTFVSSIAPLSAVNHKMPLFSSCQSKMRTLCLVASVKSLSFDFITRQKIGGTSMTLFNVKQFPILPPNYYTEADLRFIVPRVVELTYTAWDLENFFTDVWAEADETLRGAILRQWQSNQLAADRAPATSVQTPFVWHEERRALLRAELDAYYARLYGLSEQDLRYILDPQDVYGPTFPGETFRVLKEKDIRRYGEYRTRRLVLEAFAKLPATVGAHIPVEYIPPVRKPTPAADTKPARKAAQPKPTKAPKTKAMAPPQPDLFSVTTPLFAASAQMVVRERTKVTLKSLEGREWKVIPVQNAAPNTKQGDFQLISPERGLGSAIMGRREGDTVEFGGKQWTIVGVE